MNPICLALLSATFLSIVYFMGWYSAGLNKPDIMSFTKERRKLYKDLGDARSALKKEKLISMDLRRRLAEMVEHESRNHGC